jgi:hypothetical protein
MLAIRQDACAFCLNLHQNCSLLGCKSSFETQIFRLGATTKNPAMLTHYRIFLLCLSRKDGIKTDSSLSEGALFSCFLRSGLFLHPLF